ncbi:hypothetical protein B0H11DRAFT_1395204 [Mycena galericulata]|nr:hypothetical protein B0H11DRAFT_1395204 [Mycena galericulata]
MSTSNSSSTFTKRSRVYIACSNCRRRKIKCITDDSEQTSCARCMRKGLLCEYLAVNDEQNAAAKRPGDAPRPPTTGRQTGPYPSSSKQLPAYENHSSPYGQITQNSQYIPSPPPATPLEFRVGYNVSHSNPAATNRRGQRSHPPSVSPYHLPSQSPDQASHYSVPNSYGIVQPVQPSMPHPLQYPVLYGYPQFHTPTGPTYYAQPRQCVCPPGPCYCGGR